ncbi:hypothetical protein CHUAL_000685 [Chamberlinius hualienensis]
MIGSLSRTLVQASQVRLRQFSTSAVKNSGGGRWYYRVGPDPPPRHLVWIANGVGGFMWWWILWHVWHEPEHIFGSFADVSPSSFTNAELGIPDDDED